MFASGCAAVAQLLYGVTQVCEMYSLVFMEFLKYAQASGMLYSVADSSFTGPSLMSEVMDMMLYPPLLQVLTQIHVDLTKHYSLLEKHGSRTYSRAHVASRTIAELTKHQVMVSTGKIRQCCHIPLFTAEHTAKALQLLDASWECVPLDLQRPLSTLTNQFQEFYGVKYTAPLTNLLPRHAPRQCPTTPHLSVPTPVQVHFGRSHSRHVQELPFIGNSDSKPITPSENASLVRLLLRLQEQLQPLLDDCLGSHSFELRLRWLAGYPFHLLLLIAVTALWQMR
eukprot:NODE_2156_length_975_cov_93.937365_g1770_i0.p1 GENE.NODE_2156_length_975_cov_93.937365_g1770_i0~~NODE_2156_length_975_cov_93.937365_g1770_i0.p1  ORF type:complete len:282 (-),score=53.14 NODE_2156_length_975_cov_93.937365_g1770_i0:70-915(-)